MSKDDKAGRGRSACRIAVLLAGAAVSVASTGCRGRAAEAPAVAQETVSSVSPAATAIVALIDLSNSFAPLTGTAHTALEALAEALGQWSGGRDRRTLAVSWGVIGAEGEHATPLCPHTRFIVTDLIPRRLEPGEFSDPQLFRKALLQCVEHVVQRSERVESYTDIAGALRFAGEVAPASLGDRVFIALSDFKQVLPAGARAVPFDVAGARVALLYGRDAATVDNSQVLARVEEWKRLLESAKAQRVCAKPLAAVTAAGLSECLY